MKRPTLLYLALGLATIASSAHAVPVPHRSCPARGFGVPTRSGPPNWWDPAPPGGTGDPTLDDPRWNGATGQSFHLGGAEAPLHTKALWGNEGGKNFLYLSFVSDLFPSTNLQRDVFLGFRRAHADSGQFAYILQFHLGAASTGDAQALAYCGEYASCPNTTSWWRVFLDTNVNEACIDGPTGEQFTAFNGGGADPVHTPPFTWLNQSIRFWQIAATGALRNRWAVQMRIPFVPTAAAWQANHGYAVNDQVTNGDHTYKCITAGISAPSGGPTGAASNITDGAAHWASIKSLDAGMEEGSTFWYEATENPTIGAPYTSIGKYPTADADHTGVTTSVCVNPPGGFQDSLIHQELGAAPGCLLCNLQDFSALTAFGAAPPPPPNGCDAGLRIDPGNIGALYDPASSPGFDVNVNSPPNEFNAPQLNRVIAQVKNTTGAAIDQPLMARFRLANWGTTVFTAGSTDIGAFEAIPGTANGVCAAGAAPACTGSFSIGAGGQRAITFDWTLTDNQKCSYQIPGTVCSACVCDHTGATPCDPDPNTPVGAMGTHFASQPCIKKHFQHQCMYVELSSPNGAVNFEQQSAYRNMDFGPMSVLAREALVDARKLPVEKGQSFQDIYLMVMPRNMPASVPPTTKTVDLVQNSVIDAALRIAQPYNDDLDHMPGDLIPGIAKRLDHPALSVRATDGDERVRKILRARQVMSKADLARVDALLGVAFNQTQSKQPSSAQIHNAVALLGPEVAAEVVPTLDIYPFYLPGAKGHIYQPMTAFTIFLSHEDTLSGVQYQLDGADQVGENVYHLRIPVGNARKIQIRAQALVGNEAKLPLGNPSWPCAGGCAGCAGANRSCGLVTAIGNSGPGLLAGVFVIGRRRRKREPKRPSQA